MFSGYTTGQNKSDNSFEFEVEKSMDRKEPENGDEEESTEGISIIKLVSKLFQRILP